MNNKIYYSMPDLKWNYPVWYNIVKESMERMMDIAKPKYIPLFVARLVVKLNMTWILKRWFGGTYITEFYVVNNQLNYKLAKTRQSKHQRLKPEILHELISMRIKLFKTCSKCGKAIDPSRYGINSLCKDCTQLKEQ